MTKKTTKAAAVATKKATPARAEKTLGREGTAAHLIRSLILKGLDNGAILKAARKAFPKAEIASHWPSWYRAEMRRVRGYTEAETSARA